MKLPYPPSWYHALCNTVRINTNLNDFKAPSYSHNQACNAVPLTENSLASGRSILQIKPSELISLMTPFSYFFRCHFSIEVPPRFLGKSLRLPLPLRGGCSKRRAAKKSWMFNFCPCHLLASQGGETGLPWQTTPRFTVPRAAGEPPEMEHTEKPAPGNPPAPHGKFRKPREEECPALPQEDRLSLRVP